MGILEQFLHVRQAVETSAVEGCAEDRGSGEHDKVEKGFRAGDSILGLQSLCAMVLYPNFETLECSRDEMPYERVVLDGSQRNSMVSKA